MLDFLKENKVLTGIIVAVVLVVGGYFAYGTGSSDELLTTTDAGTPTSQVSKELLSVLANLKSISLDTSIFTDPAFLSLSDFGTTIPLEPVGRDNPFAPLTQSGVRAGASTGSGTLQSVPRK